ncbi:MAG: lipopolysaccharide heptosyltransferase II [Candidatus Omnitrophota bacterium]
MRILQVLPTLNYGGVERGTIDLAKKLIAAGHEAFCISGGGEFVPDLEKVGATHYTLPVDKKSLFNILWCVERMARFIKENRIDLVHARSRVPGWIAYLACRRTQTKFITTCHGYYSQNFGGRVMGWGNVCIVPSRVIARHMIEDFGVQEEKICIIPRGVDLKSFTYNPKPVDYKKEFVVAMIGRVTPLKGHKYFLKAVSRLARVIPKMKIIIVGDAPRKKQKYMDELLTQVRRFGLEKYVEFIPGSRDIPALLAGIDCLVMASIAQEAFGRVVVEAQAVGVPVVATKVGGIIDIIEDGKTGLLVDPCDVEMMCGAILKIYQGGELAGCLRQKAREKIEKEYTLDLMAERTMEVYKKEIIRINILIIKLSALGDMILATPSFRAVREKFPNALIFLLTTDAAKEAAAGCPYINRIIMFEKAGSGLLSILKTSKKLRKYNFDIVIDLQNNRKSHLLSFLSGSYARYGWDNGKFSFLLNYKRSKIKTKLDPVAHQQKLLDLLDIKIKDKTPAVWISEEDERYADDFLKDNWLIPSQALIGFNLSSSAKWQTKRWPLENFIKLAQILTKEIKARIVLTGIKQDAELCDYFRKNSKCNIINACGKTTFSQMAALIKRCNVYVTADSAPLHVAAAVKTPFVAFFGPTDPDRHMPAETKGIVLNKKVSCSPCYKQLCRNLKCLKRISVEEAKEAIVNLLKETHPSPTP